MNDFTGIKINASGLLLSDDLKFQISNAIGNNIDFALLNPKNMYCIFIGNKYMVTVNGKESSFTFLPNAEALMNAVSLCVAAYRTFKPLLDLLSNGDIETLKEIASVKCLT